MLSEVKTTESKSAYSGALLPVLGIGALGVLGYFGYKAWDNYREEEAINKANESALKSTLNIKRTQEKINKLETTKGTVIGVTARSQRDKKTVNIFDQVKGIINEFYIKLTDKYGTDKYIKKSTSAIDQDKVRNIVEQTPFIGMAKLQKLYNIYTGKSFKEDILKLDPMNREKIKTYLDISFSKFPQTYK